MTKPNCTVVDYVTPTFDRRAGSGGRGVDTTTATTTSSSPQQPTIPITLLFIGDSFDSNIVRCLCNFTNFETFSVEIHQEKFYEPLIGGHHFVPNMETVR